MCSIRWVLRTIFFVLLLLAAGVYYNRMELFRSVPLFLANRNFDISQIPDVTGKVVIVTGGNSGVGYESAKVLAKKGATVIIGCRSKEKGLEAIQLMKKETNNDKLKVEFIELELSSFKSIRKFSTEFSQRFKRLDVLMANAGKLFFWGQTEEGIEMNLGVHHVGHFYLTFLLMPILIDSAPSRIVVVASDAHLHTYSGGIDFDNINNPNTFSVRSAYGQSKLANLLFSRKLHSELRSAGVNNIFVNSLHPGFVSTDFSAIHNIWPISALAFNLSEGSLTQLYLASSPEIEEKSISGEYYYPIAVRAEWGTETSPETVNSELQNKLWDWTVNIIKNYDKNIDFTIKPKKEKEVKEECTVDGSCDK